MSVMKDFINEGRNFLAKAEGKEVKKENKAKAVPHIELVLENDSDFIFRRTTPTTSNLLVCILSQGIIYIKNEKNGEMKTCGVKDFEHFLSGSDFNYRDKGVTFKQLKYSPWEKGLCSARIGAFMAYAIKHTEKAKELVNHKIFLGEDCFTSKEALSLLDILPLSELANKLAFIEDVFLNTDENKHYYTATDVLKTAINFFAKLEKVGVNFDKIKHNAENLRIISQDSYWWRGWGDNNWIDSCIEFGNLDFNRFMNYLVYLVDNEGLELLSGGWSSSERIKISDYYDYLKMQKEMYGSIKEKYPENWLSEHHKLVKTYAAWKKLHENDIILERAKALEKYQYSNKKYTVVIPTNSAQVVDEGYQLGHCVGSYVNRIVEGETNIVFVRYKETPEESLVTVEINNKGSIIQCRGKGNRDVTPEENDFLREWAEKVNLSINV